MKQTLQILLLFSLTFLGTANVFAEHNERWNRTTDVTYHLSFVMPSKPEKVSRFTNNIPSTIYTYRTRYFVFGVVISDLKVAGLSPTGKETVAIYENIKDQIASLPAVLIKKETTQSLDNMLVRDIEYATVKGSTEITHIRRVIIRDGLLIQLSMNGTGVRSEFWNENQQLFFDGLRFDVPVNEAVK